MFILQICGSRNYRYPLRRIIGIALFFCLMPGGFYLFGEPGDDAVPVVAVGTALTGQSENIELRDLVQSSLVIEVERFGYQVVQIEAWESTTLEVLSEEYGTRLFLLCYVSEEGDTLSLELELTSVDNPELTARTVKEGRIDLDLDLMITEAVSDILYQLREYAPRLVQTSPAAGKIAAEAVSEPAAEPDRRDREAPADAMLYRPFRISAGAAPFLAVGKVNYYFSIGLLASLRGGYTFRTSIGDIETGLFLGVNYFNALGLEDSSSNLLIPLGVSVRYGTGIGRRLQVFASVTGGPALFLLMPAEGEQLFKVTGYAGAGGGGSLLFSDRLGLTLEIDYILFFEQYYPIMGVVPSLYFDVRF